MSRKRGWSRIVGWLGWSQINALAQRRPRNWAISRRSRFDGRPACEASNCGIALRSSAIFRRNSRLAFVSRYKVCATDAGPRISLSSRTSISKSPLSFFTLKRSPTRTSRAAFAVCPLLVIRPRPQARAANARVLKNRAAHSHLSVRKESTLHFATTRRSQKKASAFEAGTSLPPTHHCSEFGRMSFRQLRRACDDDLLPRNSP